MRWENAAQRAVDVIERSGVSEAVWRRVTGPVLRRHKLCVSIYGCARIVFDRGMFSSELEEKERLAGLIDRLGIDQIRRRLPSRS